MGDGFRKLALAPRRIHWRPSKHNGFPPPIKAFEGRLFEGMTILRIRASRFFGNGQ